MSELQSGILTDSLRIVLTRDGKKVYDSLDKIPKLGFPTEPLKFCPACGSESQPIIYMCKCCGIRFIQQIDLKTGRKIVVILEQNEEY